MSNGIKETFKNYEPAWFYFSAFFGMLYGQYLESVYPNPINYDRVILRDEEEGNLVLDVAGRESESYGKDDREKVVILLHGITGNTHNYYMQLMVEHLIKSGFNTVALNHFGVENEKDCRLMYFGKQKYIDEVISYSVERFSKSPDKPCDIFLFGYSLGGNHILRYQGAARKNRLMKTPAVNDGSSHIKGVVSISAPFDQLTTSIKL